jgi:hypothetical protein
MGNILASIGSIWVPLFTHLVTVPFIFHPLRWGGIPWGQPHWLLLGIVTFLCNAITLMGLGTISGLMTTKKECNRTNILRSIKQSLWLVLGFVIGNLIMFLLPFLKVPVLLLTLWLPYAGWIAHGICVFPAVLFCGALGNGMLRGAVCTK